jgi:hypothetical protein
MVSLRSTELTTILFADSVLLLRIIKRKPPADHLLGIPRCEESGHPTPASRTAAGFRMPLTEPGVRLSLRTGLSLDVHA